jgi:hypothetical protein
VFSLVLGLFIQFIKVMMVTPQALWSVAHYLLVE